MYSYIYSLEYNFIFWVRSDTDNNLFNDYKSIGEYVKILNEDNDNYEECIKIVNSWLKVNKKWLLIFDDCEDYEQIYSYIPNNYSGHIIITSKNSDWVKLVKPLKVDPFTEEEAIKLLLKRSNKIDEIKKDDDIKSLLKKAGLEVDNSVYKLANKLGNLPLALNQAAAYIEENCISFDEYIKLYDNYQLSLFEKNYDSKDYNYTVRTVWKISLEKIQKKLPLSIRLVKFLSVFGNNKIPNWILKDKLNVLKELLDEDINILNYNDAISLLKKYALIESNGMYFHMHCLIQSVIQNEMNEKDEFDMYSDIVSKFIYKILPDDLGTNDEWKGVSDLMPHLRYLIGKINMENGLYIKLFFKLGLCERFKLGAIQAEHTIEEVLVLALTVYNELDPKLANIYNMLAGIKKDRGNIDEAKKYYYRSLKILENEGGEENNYNIPIIKNNIGLVLLQEEDYINSKIMFKDALELYNIDEKFYIKQIAITLSNLSIVNVKLKEYDEANDNVDRSLRLIEIHLGKDNVVYSRTLNNKGNIFLDLKDYKNAKEYFEKSVKLDEDFYPENHTEVINKKNNLSMCLINLGKSEIEQARNILNNVIEVGRNSESNDSIAFASIFNTLALIYEKEENYELAIKYYDESKKIFVEIYGKLSLKVSECDKYIAECLLKIDKQQALNMYEDILKNDQAILEEFKDKKKDLKNIQEIIEKELVSLGILFADEEIKRYKDSIEYIKNALRPTANRYGDKSVEVTACIRTLSKAYYELGDYNNAYKYANKALKNDLENFSYNSEEVALAYNNLAYILYILGNKEKSTEFINEAKNIVDKIIGISLNTVEIIKENSKIIMHSDKDNIIDTIKKYHFEIWEHDKNLLIRPILRK
jgi:tetratricopeptide (TPR) repeat protein